VLYREGKCSVVLGISKFAEVTYEGVIEQIKSNLIESVICDHVLLNDIKVSSERFLINKVIEANLMLLGGRWSGRVVRVLWGEYDPLKKIYVDHYGIKFKVENLKELMFALKSASAQ